MTTIEPPAAPVTAERYEQPLVAPESLRPWITEIGHIPTLYDLPPAFTHVPRAVTTIVLRSEPSGRRDAYAVGPHTRAAYAPAEQPAGCTRLRLAPGATRPLLGLSASDLADRAVRLAEVPGPAAQFADQLTEMNAEEALCLLESELPQRLLQDSTQRSHRRILDSAVDAMTANPGSVRELADVLAVSERQLRNLFTDGIGVSPKYFARIARLRRVLDAAGNTPWADIAMESGFYDQSHMTSDFRTLMGVTPGKFFKGTLPGPTACHLAASN